METPGAGQRGSLEPHRGLKNKFPQQPLSRPALGKPGLCEGVCAGLQLETTSVSLQAVVL